MEMPSKPYALSLCITMVGVSSSESADIADNADSGGMGRPSSIPVGRSQLYLDPSADVRIRFKFGLLITLF